MNITTRYQKPSEHLSEWLINSKKQICWETITGWIKELNKNIHSKPKNKVLVPLYLSIPDP